MCDRRGTPLGATLSSAARHDSAFVEQVLQTVSVRQGRGRPKNRPKCLVAERAYDAGHIRRYAHGRGIAVMIPERRLAENRKRRKRGPRPQFDKQKYKERNVVERLIYR